MKRKKKRRPGDKWTIYGPGDYWPPIEVGSVTYGSAFISIDAIRLYLFTPAYLLLFIVAVIFSYFYGRS